MKTKKKIVTLVILALMAFAVTGCSAIQGMFSRTTENLTGKAFTLTEYDHFGNETMRLSGESVAIGLLENNANWDEESTGYKSDVLEITMDGSQVFQVGNTCLIAEQGIDLVTDFSVPDEITTDSAFSFIPADRFINDLTNAIGKEKVIIVSSQMGVPIGVYQGKDVYVSVPDDLPKTTHLSIDGKSLYIHRANYTILDADMLEE